MVRSFDYHNSDEDVLKECQSALEKLGYTIAWYESTNRYLITEVKSIRVGLRKANYLLYVKVEDRVRVYVYAETQVFKRFQEWGIWTGELTQSEASVLPLSFQRAIFEPIAKAFKKSGIEFWDDWSENIKGKKEVKNWQEDRYKKRKLKEARMESSQKKTWESYLSLTQEEKDNYHLEAVLQAENFVKFWQSKDTSFTGIDSASFWFLIHGNKNISELDNDLKDQFYRMLSPYSSYRGEAVVIFVLTPQGRVKEVFVDLNVYPNALKEDLEQLIKAKFLQMYFPFPENYPEFFLIMKRNIKFFGVHRDMQFNISKHYIIEIVKTFPPQPEDRVKGVYFSD